MENYRPTLDWRCSSSMKKREREKRNSVVNQLRKSRRIKGIYHCPSPANQPFPAKDFTKFFFHEISFPFSKNFEKPDNRWRIVIAPRTEPSSIPANFVKE